jgi:Kef-type K+ transport system membrane component KefB
LLFSWLATTKVPSVIVEIIMGVIIGPYVLDFVEDVPCMDFHALTGFLKMILL